LKASAIPFIAWGITVARVGLAGAGGVVSAGAGSALALAAGLVAAGGGGAGGGDPPPHALAKRAPARRLERRRPFVDRMTAALLALT
jgi:hypothetical protein